MLEMSATLKSRKGEYHVGYVPPILENAGVLAFLGNAGTIQYHFQQFPQELQTY